jgi:hypothetical protein
LGFNDIEPTSVNATMEYRNSQRIPTKYSMAVKKSTARTKSVINMGNRYANESKMKLDHTSFI